MPEAETAAAKPLPVVPFLKIPEEGEPYLEGHKCGHCGEVFLGKRMVCGNCGTRNQMSAVKLAKTGKLYNFTIVHRNFPGVPVPFISAIVDLDGGGTVKGNLINIEPDPKKISFGMPVEVVYKDALGRKDREGNAYLSYFFQPAR